MDTPTIIFLTVIFTLLGIGGLISIIVAITMSGGDSGGNGFF